MLIRDQYIVRKFAVNTHTIFCLASMNIYNVWSLTYAQLTRQAKHLNVASFKPLYLKNYCLD